MMGCAAMAGMPYADETASDSERITALELQVSALTKELEKDRFADVVPELGETHFGMGPGASKVYNQDQGLSIGGYGEGLYQNFEGDKTDEADFLRAIIYLGYKFNDKWVLNTEFEFEHASTSEDGSTSVEFAYLDYLMNPALNLRAGLVLVPVGVINELHEPTVFLSATRPLVENRIIPTTWRENGAGLFGEAGIVSYKLYVVNSLDAEGFSASGIRGGRQKGSEAKADDFSVVGRVDVTPNDIMTVGSSVYYGDQGQDLDVDGTLTLIEGHVIAKWAGFKLTALAVQAEVDAAAELSRAIAASGLAEGEALPADADISAVGEEMFGWYVELGYDLLSVNGEGEASLTPYIRYEELNTQDKVASGFTKNPANDLEVFTFGLNYQPIDEIVFKAEQQLIEDGNGNSADQFNLAMGYVF